MTTLSEKERQVVLQIIRALNPREDTVGCLMSKSNAYKMLGDKGIAILARKLDGALDSMIDDVVVVNGNVPHDKAKDMVVDYYKAHPGKELYPSDVAIALKLDCYLVFEICNELELEGFLNMP